MRWVDHIIYMDLVLGLCLLIFWHLKQVTKRQRRNSLDRNQ